MVSQLTNLQASSQSNQSGQSNVLYKPIVYNQMLSIGGQPYNQMNIVGGSTDEESFLPKINSNSSKKSFYQEKPGLKSTSKSTEKPRAGSI
mmetsp:Transcript_19390/g.29764  ORF Transcript_19390/g.29764 Transcript_19390/m.29764 type:complete len:91 (-) Transcript_19390:1003-1275(-)